jgi:putative serine protease PepD
VGINTAGAAVSNTGGSIGLGFAIPIDLAEGIASELISEGKVTRPSLGIQIQPISAGLFVQAVTAGGSADRAGLRPGDVITEVNGEPADSVDILIAQTLKLRAGDVLRLTYERQGASRTAGVKLTAG